MKIVHFLHKPIMAGAQRASFEILKSLNSHENELYLIYADDESFDIGLRMQFVCEFESIGVKLIPLKSLKQKIGLSDIQTCLELGKILKKINPNVFNTISSKPFLIGGIVSWVLKIPMRIHTIQGLSWFESMPFFKKKFRYSLELISCMFFHKIVFVNRFYMDYFPFHKQKFLYIPNGKEFSKLNFKGIHTLKKEIRVLFVGRLDFQKDPMTMLKSFHLFLMGYNGDKNVVLDIVGDGPLRSELQDYVFSNKILETKVCFHGWTNTVDDFFKKADVFISTPRYEAFGIVFIEAANYNLPIVSSNIEGVPEVVINGKGGFLSKVGDIESTCEHLLNLVQNDLFRSEMGVFHGKYCRENFENNFVLKKYHDLYYSL
jgi:glycosyltransferase involved in cell wall biosynthesis